MSLDLTVTDLFCGAGGSSIGAERSGARLRMAANHWSLAIETHNSNFPEADHDCADISQVDPRRYPRTDILLASPECTHHSIARSRRHDPNLFNPKGDPSAERSRATMWDVPRFAEHHSYECVVVENVVEIRRWAPFPSWLAAMRDLGYEHEAVYLNSMVAPPTPQSRDRIYVVFWKAGNRKPDLDIRPLCACDRCGDVDGRQAWKKPDRPGGKYRQQYIYRCATCGDQAVPYAWPAASAIDWSLPCPRIGDRTKPLAEATLRRIKVGLERFGPAALVQRSGHTFERPGYVRAWPTWTPFPTQTTEIHHALVVETAFGGDDRVRSGVEPFATQTGRQTIALAIPMRTNGRAKSVEQEPLATMTAGNGGGGETLLTFPAFYVKNYTPRGRTEQMVKSVEEPLGSVTCQDHHSLVSMPFMVTRNDPNGSDVSRVRGVDEPIPTQTANYTNHVLVNPDFTVEDCGFRMLEPHEIGRAMAFPDSYKVLGNKREKVRQYGNAVTPPVMSLLVERCIGSLA